MHDTRSLRPSLVVGTRGSRLALAQTAIASELLRAAHPTLAVQIRQIVTAGDRDQRSSLTRIGGQGVFVKEIERALLSGEIDLAVHSLKDVPSTLPEGLALAAILPRSDPRDALISRSGANLAELPAGSRVGTGSLRRQAQLRALRPDLVVEGLRGNVDTRLRRLDEGVVDAVILACAGLERLGLLERSTETLTPEMMLPAPGQGAICLQVRSDDLATLRCVAELDHPPSHAATSAERAFLREMGAGCRAALAAYAEIEQQQLRLRGLVADASGDPLVRGDLRGAVSDAEALGQNLAQELLARGGARLLEKSDSDD